MRSRQRLLVLCGIWGLFACSDDWRMVDGMQSELECGMSLQQVEILARAHGLRVSESSAGDHFTHTVRREGRMSQLLLTIRGNELETVQAFRHTGLQELCEYPELLLCGGTRRLRLTVEHSPALREGLLEVDGKESTELRGGAIDLYLPPGRHAIELILTDGSRSVHEITLAFPEECHLVNPRLLLDRNASGEIVGVQQHHPE
jgi:hypothetical protein